MTEDNGSDGAMRVEPDLVRQLAEMLDDNDLSEIEVEDGDRRIAVKRKLIAGAGRRRAGARAGRAAARRRRARRCRAAAAAASIRARSSRRWSAPSISPPSRARKPFVSVGERSPQGDTLLIIEAMKVMNPITAPRARHRHPELRPERRAGRVRPAAGRSST